MAIDDHVNEPPPFDTESLPWALAELRVELEAVLSLVELRRVLIESGVDVRILEARLLCRAIDQLIGGSPSIDWSVFVRQIDALEGRTSTKQEPDSERILAAMSMARETAREADPNDF